MYRKERNTLAKILKYYLGRATDYTSFEVEVVGVIMGIWMIRTEHTAGQLPITILTDSQALIKRAQMHKSTTTQYLIENLLTLAENVNVANTNPSSKNFT